MPMTYTQLKEFDRDYEEDDVHVIGAQMNHSKRQHMHGPGKDVQGFASHSTSDGAYFEISSFPEIRPLFAKRCSLFPFC